MLLGKVLLTGIGGDELSWGYEWVARAAKINQYSTVFWQRLFSKKNRNFTAPKGFLNFYDITPDFSYAKLHLKEIYGSALNNLPTDNAYIPVDIGLRTKEQIPAGIIRLLFDTWLIGNCLTLGDRVSMGASVESRLPFLEPKFIELVMALRRNAPDHTLKQKAWLRAALKDNLPDEVLSRPKRGFQPPVWEWLDGVVDRYGDSLIDGYLQKNGVIAPNAPEEMLRCKSESWDRLFIAYKLVLLEMWIQQLQ